MSENPKIHSGCVEIGQLDQKLFKISKILIFFKFPLKYWKFGHIGYLGYVSRTQDILLCQNIISEPESVCGTRSWNQVSKIKLKLTGN